MFTIVYLTHLMSFAMAAIILTSFAILAHKPLRLIFLSWLMFVPGFVLYFYARAPLASAPASSVGFGTFHSKILGLAYPLRGFSKFLDFFSLTILLLCVVAVVLRDKGFRLHFPWFVTTVLLVALYFATPGQIGDGGYIDLRILLYAFIVALASFRIQGLKRFVVLAGLALIVARSVELTYHFVAEQASLEKVIASLVVIPAQSRVLPLEPRWEGDRSIIFRPYMYAYAYGIVDKGWIAPSLMGVGIGVRPIRLSQDIYCPNKICGPLIETEPDWTRVQRDYDFIWAYNLPYYTPKLERLGSCVYNEGPVRVFRMNR